MKPSAIVFDLGKVLLDFDYSIAARRIAARCSMSLEEVRQHLDHSPLLYQFETGPMTVAEFFNEVSARTKFSGTESEFCEYFADIFSEIPPMVELNDKLRAKGFPTYIFSNTNELAIGHIRARFPFFKNFHAHILSYEHGSMKPDKRLYEVVERETGRRGAEILYLDDRSENIEAGAARGWQTILQVSPEKTLQEIQRLNLL